MVQERIDKLRELMEVREIDAYLIPTSDFHESEYVGDFFKSREFMTGFTGSAGTAVVTKTEAGLWTDGRYFVQAAKELAGSGVTLYKMGQESVPTVEEFLENILPENGCLGFDGRVLNARTGEGLMERLAGQGVAIAYQEDLVGEIWEERPALSAEPVWILDEKYSGKPAAKKIGELRCEMKKNGASVHLITTLDDIAWLLNIRGNDVECNPVVLSYAAVTMDQFYLFINDRTLDDGVKTYLKEIGVTLKPYDQVYEYAAGLKDETVLLETAKVNYSIYSNLDHSNEVVDRMNPTSAAKAVKNSTETENMRRAHILDGVVMTKFIYWLKTNIGKIPMTEVSAAEYLDKMRWEQESNLGLSFPTISAYGANAAMCHYHAEAETCAKIEPRGLYLVDSGGQYYEGTTDVTRTVALGGLTDEEREHFTLIAMSMLRLGAVKFLYGCRGLTLDYVAREPLWKRGLNFDHGTGHGVGYLLNVHERPNGIRWKMVEERQDNCVLEEGMITSDEPGLYIEGKHGIRTENLVLCKKGEKNEYGQFMEFEYLTFVPIDLDAIDKTVMEPEDIALLNAYHEQVYDKISPYLSGEERDWLKKYTRAI